MTRLEKFESLRRHAYYSRDFEKLSQFTYTFIVRFIKDNDPLDNNEFTLKVTQLWSDGTLRPKNHGAICDLLLASRTEDREII